MFSNILLKIISFFCLNAVRTCQSVSVFKVTKETDETTMTIFFVRLCHDYPPFLKLKLDFFHLAQIARIKIPLKILPSALRFG
jgi:hypothetical protein